jgi:hypothetical protein
MNKEEQSLNNTENAKLGISDVSCSVCGLRVKTSTGHSMTWTGIYDIKRCGCGTKVCKKHYN